MNHSIQKLNEYKSRGEYRIAGQFAALHSLGDTYGCHFGMRSTYRRAIDEFCEGWNEIDDMFRKMQREMV